MLAFHYPPTTEVGGLRAAKVARALADAGYHVTVIRAHSDSRAASAPEHPSVDVISITVPAGPRQWLADIRSSDRSPPPSRQGEAPVWRPPATVPLWKRILYSVLWLPDDQQGFVIPAAKTAVECLRQGGPVLLYSTSPPPSVQLAALACQIVTGATWVAELRDPWTDNPGKPWYCRTALTDWIERQLERICLNRADLVVAVSEGVRRLARDKQRPGVRAPVLVRNGIDGLVENIPARPQDRPFRIVHIGTLYLGRDPRPFLAALAVAVRRLRLPPERLRVELIGKSETFDGNSIREYADSLGIGPFVSFEPWLPHETAQERIRTADLLLLLAEGQPDQVPNKLYEYLATRQRILAFADRPGETANLLERVGGHLVVNSADSSLDEVVANAIAPQRTGESTSNEVLAELATPRQMVALLRELASLPIRIIR
ncbi:MAG: glycosyltransferase [Gemmatimonadales bacterium]